MESNNIKNIPRRIFLQIGEEASFAVDYKKLTEVTFSVDKIFDNDIEYKRVKMESNNISAEDFLRQKFGHFNRNHPLNLLGYNKGLELDIEDIITIMEEYKLLNNSSDISAEEMLKKHDVNIDRWPDTKMCIIQAMEEYKLLNNNRNNIGARDFLERKFGQINLAHEPGAGVDWEDIVKCMEEYNLLNNNGWIKFTDKFPELDEFVLLEMDGNIPVLACYKGENKFLDISLNEIWDIKEDHIYLWFKLPIKQ